MLVGLAVFLCCFAFADPTGSGTYNFLAPYSHEMTHGFLLSLVALSLVVRLLERPALGTAVAIGLTLGLVFLTKSELFVAIATVAVLGVLLALREHRDLRWRERAQLGLAFVACPMVPLLVAFGLLRTNTSSADAVASVLGSWRFAFSSELRDLDFYRVGMGLLDPKTSLRELFIWLFVYGLVLALPLWLAFQWKRNHRLHRALPWVSGLFAAMITFVASSRLSVLDASRPLPLVLLVVLGLLAVPVWRRTNSRSGRASASACLLAILFALLLLLKVLLRVRLAHYGFVLAAPAMLAWVVVLLDTVPAWVDRRGGQGWVFRAAGFGFLAVVTLLHLTLTAQSYAAKTTPVGEGRDAFLADRGGEAVTETLTALERHLETGDTLAVLPEGVMINYLARRANPTPFYNFMPPELIMFGEGTIIEAFEAAPPDWVVMTGRGATEYGFDYLGRGYGQQLADWIRQNYSLVERVGTEGPPDPAILSWTMILEREP